MLNLYTSAAVLICPKAELKANGNGGLDAVKLIGDDSWCAHQVLNATGAGNSCIDYRGYTVRGNYSCKEVSGQNICAAN